MSDVVKDLAMSSLTSEVGGIESVATNQRDGVAQNSSGQRVASSETQPWRQRHQRLALYTRLNL